MAAREKEPMKHKTASAEGEYAVDIRADKISDTYTTDVNPSRKGERRLMLVLAAVAAVLIGGGLLFAVLSGSKEAPVAADVATAAERNAQLVTVVSAAARPFARTALVSGQVRPVQDISVFAQSNGVRIAEVLVDIGDVVEEGQPLARLDAGLAEAQILAAQAQLQEARIEQARAAEEFARVAPIADSGALSKEEIDTRRSAAAAADARLAAQRAAYEQVKARLQGGFVRAPAAGLVIERTARVGEIAEQKSLFRIVGGNRLEVAAAVSERDILMLKTGQKARFVTGDGQVIEAVLRRPPVAINPNTGTGEALFDLPADTTVRSGMYLRGEVIVQTENHIAAPQSAISYANDEPSIFIVEDGVAKLRPVKLGATQGDFVAILSGVKAGETIASSGGAFLLDGDKVRVIDPAAAPAPKAASATSN